MLCRLHWYRLPITTNEIIRINLKVYESLDRNNSVITQYTTQYEDRINNTIIRAYRSYPHIDLQLQLQHGNKEKRIFDRSFGL